MIGMDSMMTRARLRYTRDNLTPGIYQARSYGKIDAISNPNPLSHVMIVASKYHDYREPN